MSLLSWLCGSKRQRPEVLSPDQTWKRYVEARIAEQSKVDVATIATETGVDIDLIERTLRYPTLWRQFGAIYFSAHPELIEALTHRENVLHAYCRKDQTFEEQQASGLRDLVGAIEWVIKCRVPTPHPAELMALPKTLLAAAKYLGVKSKSIEMYPLEIALEDIMGFACDASEYVFWKHAESYGEDLPRIIETYRAVFGQAHSQTAKKIQQMIAKRFESAATEEALLSIELPPFIQYLWYEPINVVQKLRMDRLGVIRWEQKKRQHDADVARILEAAKATKT